MVIKAHYNEVCACVRAKLLQSCLTLCNPVDCSPSGSSVHRIPQERTLEWVVMPSCRGSSQPRNRTCNSCIAGGFFTAEPLGKPMMKYNCNEFPQHKNYQWERTRIDKRKNCKTVISLGMKIDSLRADIFLLLLVSWSPKSCLSHSKCSEFIFFLTRSLAQRIKHLLAMGETWV